MDEIKQPNSKRFWRLNEIEGIRADFEGMAEPAATPEEKIRREENKARLSELEAQESRVRERYERMIG